MLNSLAFIFAKEFLDLAVLVLALVQGDSDLVVRGGHRSRDQGRLLPLDVEIAYLPEVEEAFVELGPMVHPAAIDVVGEVVERVESDRARAPLRSRRLEIDVVDLLGAVAVDEIEVGAANALDRGDFELAGPARGLDRRGAAFHGHFKGFPGVLDTEGHAVGRGAVRLSEVG